MGVFSSILSLLPLVGGVVNDVEQVFGNKSGAAKRAAAVQAAGATVNALQSAGVVKLPATGDQLEADLGELIDAIVKVQNDLGVFTHKTAPGA